MGNAIPTKSSCNETQPCRRPLNRVYNLAESNNCPACLSFDGHNFAHADVSNICNIAKFWYVYQKSARKGKHEHSTVPLVLYRGCFSQYGRQNYAVECLSLINVLNLVRDTSFNTFNNDKRLCSCINRQFLGPTI